LQNPWFQKVSSTVRSPVHSTSWKVKFEGCKRRIYIWWRAILSLRVTQAPASGFTCLFFSLHHKVTLHQLAPSIGQKRVSKFSGDQAGRRRGQS
jgi:hypothetical protein